MRRGLVRPTASPANRNIPGRAGELNAGRFSCMRRGLIRLNAGGPDAGGLIAGRVSCVRRGLLRLNAGGLVQVGSMRVALSASLVQKLVKLADSERKDGVVLILLALLVLKYK